jgi:peptidoglycan/xylan/chitin deacetylase (PgdA/CDA1 family)
MLGPIFTSDYEIHGNGDGCPMDLMVEPTRRMLDLFDEYGAKLTIMADIAEILKFSEYKSQFGRDDYYYEAIIDQLRDAIRRGHDVQLHIHSSFFNARYEQGRWAQDWSEYNFAGLPPQRLKEVIALGKEFLESLLQPVDPQYQCYVFRAANWSMSPSRDVVQALLDNGIKIDTSVFKYGYRRGLVSFDYSSAFSELVPWRVDQNDICRLSRAGALVEFPIYSENRWVGAFLTPQRLQRAYMTRQHRIANGDGPSPDPAAQTKPNQYRENGSWLLRRSAWKADFNQCSGRQLVGALKRAEAHCGATPERIPFVLIGHSKLFTRFNAWSLRSFLSFVRNNPERFWFAKFNDFDTSRIGEQFQGKGQGRRRELEKAV